MYILFLDTPKVFIGRPHNNGRESNILEDVDDGERGKKRRRKASGISDLHEFPKVREVQALPTILKD